MAHVDNNKTHILFNLPDMHSEQIADSKHAVLLINSFSPFFVYLPVSLLFGLPLPRSSTFLIKVYEHKNR